MTKLTSRYCPLVLAFLISFGALGSATASEIAVATRDGSAMVDFGLAKLQAALQSRNRQLVRLPLDQRKRTDVLVLTDSEEAEEPGLASLYSNAPGPDGFHRARIELGSRRVLAIAGGDERGAMYGLLELAELTRQGVPLERIPERQVRAEFPFRAIKFNLPWMSYRKGESLQLHHDTCRDLGFWEAFLDMMAENRFNALTLWNLHPFTFLIRPKNFPEASGFSDAELAEWQLFWKGLFRMAKNRGIETYLVNWNIFVSPEMARANNVATYSIDWTYFHNGDTSELVERYTRECVTQVLDEYPELTGLGITLGEGMGGMTPDERRDWINRAFLEGMKAAKREAKLIYRAPLSAGTGSGGSTSVEAEQLTRQAIERLELPKPIWVELKFNWSHAHSSPRLFIVHGGKLTDTYWNPPPQNYRMVYTMRNEDFFVLRWGEPDFVRQFIKHNQGPHLGGCIIGSECYIPAADYITVDGPHKTWRYAFERQWLFYAVWGRLLHDAATPDATFIALLEERFGKGTGARLLEAWKLASRQPLRFASFHGGTWDGTLYTESFGSWSGGMDRVRLFGIDSFINRGVLDTSYVNIRDFVRAGRQAPAGKVSPLQLADTVERDCAEAMRIVAALRDQGKLAPALECELADIESWCNHGRYFAEKLRGGVALAAFRADGDAAQQQQAVAALERAAEHWQALIESTGRYNHREIPFLTKERFSWEALLPSVMDDIETARNASR
jgi:hypothetical protein